MANNGATFDTKRVVEVGGQVVTTLKKLQLDEYLEVFQALIVLLNKSGASLTGTIFLADLYEGLKHANDLLERFQNGNWLKKKLIKKDFDKCVFQLEESRERITKEAPRMGEIGQDYSECIIDIEGRKFWKSKIGAAYKVSKESFLNKIAAHFTAEKIPFNSSELQKMLEIIDESNTGFITSLKFNEFLKPFGPVSKSIEKMSSIVFQRWFLGYISALEAEMLLYKQRPGVFIVRFSRSSPGSFALEYVREVDEIHHVLIKPTSTGGYETHDHSMTMGVTFPSFQALLQCFSEKVSDPLRSSFLNESWFCGEYSKECAESSLHGKSVGSFLVYRNEIPDVTAHFVISYVSPSHTVVHASVVGDPSGVGLMIRGEPKSFETLSDLVASKQSLWKTPVLIDKQDSSSLKTQPQQYASLDMMVNPKRTGANLPSIAQTRDRVTHPVNKTPSPTQSRFALRGASSPSMVATPPKRPVPTPPRGASPLISTSASSSPAIRSTGVRYSGGAPVLPVKVDPSRASVYTSIFDESVEEAAAQPAPRPPVRPFGSIQRYATVSSPSPTPVLPVISNPVVSSPIVTTNTNTPRLASTNSVKEYSVGSVLIISGNTLLNDHGEAIIPLPAHTWSTSTDHNYQLTCIGGYAPIYVKETPDKKSFQIVGGTSGLKVSWQVTANKV